MDGEGFPSGFAHTLNQQQAYALKELQEKCETESPETYEYIKDLELNPQGDKFLLRFLRATMKGKKSTGKRAFEVDSALKRLEDAVKARKQLDVTNVPENFATFDKKIKPTVIYHDPKVKHIVACENIASFWVNVRPESYTDEQWKQFFGHRAWKIENMVFQASIKEGIPDTRGLYVIYDLSGLGLSVASKKPLFKTLNAVLGDTFPELINKIWLVNAPYIFSAVWSVVKYILDPDIVNKIHIYSYVPTDELKSIFEPSLLPKQFGGTGEVVLPPTQAKRI